MSTRPRVVAVVQARTGSTRLPGKVLLDLAGRPMVERVLERVLAAPEVDAVVAAVPEGAADEPLARCVEGVAGVGLVRGPEDDVLARYRLAARAAGAEVVVRVTADCPLLCPEVSSRVVRRLLDGLPAADYAANTLERTYPRGLDTEAFTAAALERAAREATRSSDREHVTPFLWRQPEVFRLLSVRDATDRSDLRWTVDTEEDLELVRRIWSALLPRHGPLFGYREILELLAAEPSWPEINRAVPQRELPP
ncbi:MAG TPA: glycosyltransferase family protein [Thermoanaerobaculia bacterium]|nr:glycosyltransferase family protein [Thermoanaerobaculia bacterium]